MRFPLPVFVTRRLPPRLPLLRMTRVLVARTLRSKRNEDQSSGVCGMALVIAKHLRLAGGCLFSIPFAIWSLKPPKRADVRDGGTSLSSALRNEFCG